ncbi:hypothetical protein [Serratia oryzae]|uniref:Uncharacterized protein n=1 Tax=Serratia oryzae TaxID=2034155 RepID=A0A1S8CDF6_9GAMM|nr:hypothetical protein [Serratia oryzae]OMQ18917.1 hypothetical protein BMI79_21625 [Serratia oryzae]
MSSENRITTNFKSVQIFKLINTLAKKNKTPKSRIIEEALSDYFYEQLKESQNLLGKVQIKKNRNQLPNASFLSGLTLNMVKLNDGDIYTVPTGNINFDVSFSLPYSAFFKFDLKKKKQIINKDVIQDEIKKHLDANLASYINEYANPDAIHFFLTKSYASYHRVNDITVMVYAQLTVYILPVHLYKKDMSRFPLLDFTRITYRRFSDVAKKGWDRGKYSHLLCIDGASQAKDGGYFIGVLYEKRELTIEDFDNCWKKVPITRHGKQAYCSIYTHMNKSQLIIKRNQSKDMLASSDNAC